MTKIAQTVASKALVAVVAAAMIFTMFAPAAKAQTTEELQTMINDLMAQIAALQGGEASGESMAGGVCPFTWTRDLNAGATGADVMKLQQFLNSNADTRVAASGAGSVGAETEYYGPATGAAVSKFQVMYRADILTPNGLVNPTGYFGPSTRNKANSLCVASTSGTTTPDVDEDEDDEEVELQGEGSLDVFEMDDATDDDIQEGSEDEEIAEITMEATDGDIEVDRMTFVINDGSTANTETDPWEVFETITLWVDGEMIAEFDASDEDEYLDEDDGEFRFSGLGLVLEEDEEVEIVVGASVVGSVDNAGSATLADWEIFATEVRYFDADGVAEDDDSTNELDPTDSSSASATFTIVVEGDGEELKFSLASSNPEATDIVVEESDTTDGVTIMEYTIEAEEGDIELNELWVNVITGTADTEDVVDDLHLVIDGQEFDAEATTSSATSTDYMFDIDGEVVIDADTEITVEVVVDLKSQSGNYAVSGETIQARVTSALADLTDAEGSDDIGTTAISGTAVGETHTLVSEGIVVPVDGVTVSTDTSGENDTLGEFTIEFEVTAVEGDFYITDTVTGDADGITTATSGVEFGIEGGTATSSGTLTSTADEDTSGVFTVSEGTTETFTLRVTVDAVASGDFRVTLAGVNYTDETDGTTSTTLYTPTPAQDFRTGYETVQGS